MDEFLEWHYKLTVMENMCVIFLDLKGGAKKMPWRKTSVPLELNYEDNNAPIGSNMYGSLTPDRTHTEAGLSHASNKEAPQEQSENFQENKATVEEFSDVSRKCNSCVNIKSLLFPSMLIDGTSFR